MKGLEARKNIAKKINSELRKLFPHVKIALNYSNNFELLVAVILSAQCTDKKVNEVTTNLFKKYKTLEDYIKANPKDFEKDIYSTGFYKAKTKNILLTAKIIKQKFEGKVPRSMEELLLLPGVARKTANIVLGNAFGIVCGIAVDTHVKRLVNVLGLTSQTNPEKIEEDLMKLFPKSEWFNLTYRLIEYGRKYCIAKKHDHKNCPLTKPLRR